MPIPENFLVLLNDPNPALKIKFSQDAEEEPIVVGIRTSLRNGKGEVAYIQFLNKDGILDSFLDFYKKYDGGNLFVSYGNTEISQTPLIKLVPAAQIRAFTALYEPGGDRAWIMDHNKTKSIYRGENKWIAFAQVCDGPSCLCMFLTGENAGGVFFAEPQPHFNTLKPIAGNFNMFLNRIAKDPAALLRLIRAYITVKQHNGNNFGYLPTSYLPDASDISPIIPSNESFWKRIFR